MNAWMKYLIAIVGVPLLVFGIALTAMSVTTEQVGLGGKQVYSYDTVTGFARMQVVIDDILVLAGGEHVGATEAEGYQRVRGDFLSSGEKTADAQIKSSAGYVDHMICAGTDNAAVAGTIILYDNTAESGTAIYTLRIAALDYHIPMVLPIQVATSTGIYLGYTTTTDVNCEVYYR
jgi:hypothetical protein